MSSSNYSEGDFLFRCPLCFHQILDSQIHSHIQHCEFYSPDISENLSILSVEEIVSDYDQIDSIQAVNLLDLIQKPEKISKKNLHNKQLLSNMKSIGICPICCNHFQYSKNIPLLLPSCGHTICDLCLKSIKDVFSSFQCPLCRKRNSESIKSLPINYALLELIDKKPEKKCEIHNLEFAAYCKDEDSVLCGACILDHKDHNCLLLTDLTLNDISEKKKIKIYKEKEDLQNIKDI